MAQSSIGGGGGGGGGVTHARLAGPIVSQARLLTPTEEESGQHPVHNLHMHNQQISANLEMS